MNLFIYHENPSGEQAFQRSGDSYTYDLEDKILCVADSMLRVLTKKKRTYPYDDTGILSAEEFCKGFVQSAKRSIQKGTYSEASLNNDLKTANKGIRDLNMKLNRDPNDKLNYDIQEVIGMATVEHNGYLYYGGLEDCYVNVLRGPNLENVAPLEYQITKSHRFLQENYDENKLGILIPAEHKKILKPEDYWEYGWCGILRNNSKVKNENGEKVGWGCFTGEKEAEEFFQIRQVKLQPGDHILLLTDGMIEAISNDEFLNWFLENQENKYDFHKEMRLKILEMFPESKELNKDKTLLYYQYK